MAADSVHGSSLHPLPGHPGCSASVPVGDSASTPAPLPRHHRDPRRSAGHPEGGPRVVQALQNPALSRLEAPRELLGFQRRLALKCAIQGFSEGGRRRRPLAGTRQGHAPFLIHRLEPPGAIRARARSVSRGGLARGYSVLQPCFLRPAPAAARSTDTSLSRAHRSKPDHHRHAEAGQSVSSSHQSPHRRGPAARALAQRPATPANAAIAGSAQGTTSQSQGVKQLARP